MNASSYLTHNLHKSNGIVTLEDGIFLNDFVYYTSLFGRIEIIETELALGINPKLEPNYCFCIGNTKEKILVLGHNINTISIVDECPITTPNIARLNKNPKTQLESTNDESDSNYFVDSKMIVNVRSAKVAPNGHQYHAFAGYCTILYSNELFSYKIKNATNWFVSIGTKTERVYIAGCQIISFQRYTKISDNQKIYIVC